MPCCSRLDAQCVRMEGRTILLRSRLRSAASRRVPKVCVNPPAVGRERPSKVWTARAARTPQKTVRDRGVSINDPEVHYLVKQARSRLGAAVQAEEESRQQTLENLYSKSRLKQLKREGVVLLELEPKRDGWMFNEMIVKLSRRDGKKLPTHKLTKSTGAVVSIHLSKPTNTATSALSPIQCVVLDSSQKALRIVLPAHAAEVLVSAYSNEAATSTRTAPQEPIKGARDSTEGWGVRLDVFSKSSVAQRQLACLSNLGEVQDPSNEAEVRARMIVLNHPGSLSLARHANRWATNPSWRAAAKQALTELYGKKRLNKSQATAIASSITRSFSIWQGPPGTGKTNTLVGLMQVLILASERSLLNKKDMGTLLVCGETNACADNLAAGAIEAGLSAVRVGSPARVLLSFRLFLSLYVRSDLRHRCLEALAESSPTGQRAQAVREQAEALAAQVHCTELQLRDSSGTTNTGSTFKGGGGAIASSPTPEVIRGMNKRVQALRGKSDALLKEAASGVLQSVQVVACTCAVAGGSLLKDLGTFKVAIIDEATQATEASTLLPLMNGAECVVLAGDPKQLPPTILSQKAKTLGLDKTLFDRLLESGLQADLLAVQYRMHAAICDFPNRWFYGGRLGTGVDEKRRPPPRGLKWPEPRTVPLDKGHPKWKTCPVVLVDSSRGQESFGRGITATSASSQRSSQFHSDDTSSSAKRSMHDGGTSFSNIVEVDMALRATVALCRGGDVEDIAILTPYSAQVAALQREMTRRSDVMDVLQATVSISVSSVDAYQGREADAVIFSATRNNRQGKIGFLKDARRLNVAITRPRRALVVIAASEMLQGDEDWGRWLSWCNKFGAVVPETWLPLAPWDDDS